MSKTKITFISIGSFLGLIILIFALNIGGLSWKRFFDPKYENVKREVFEQTKSYTHGKIQDLAKYFEEYQKADMVDDKQAIKSIIQIRFSEFDASKINNTKLQQFLINMRGF